jgi:hypothetical protein
LYNYMSSVLEYKHCLIVLLLILCTLARIFINPHKGQCLGVQLLKQPMAVYCV